MTDRKTTIAYADCFSGVSGDMFVGALLDAGLPLETLRGQLDGLALPDYTIEAGRHGKNAIKATRFTVTATGPPLHRSWKDIREMLQHARLAEPVREKAVRIFSVLARAEAAVHDCPVDDVHFHEAGGVDAIVDIVGAAVGLAHFGIDRLISSPLPMPSGWVACEHGQLPLPAPAVSEMLKGAPVYGVDLRQELVTPTGAAIIMAMAGGFGPFPSMVIRQVGYGAGSRTRSDGRPNLLRLVIGEQQTASEAQEVEVIETHLDDMPPEAFPHLSELLFARGALDVALAPIQMKKGRWGFLLRAVVDPARALEVKQCILTESTAIGLRYRTEKRWTLPREHGTINTPWGAVQVKKVDTPAGPVLYPEYEDCRRLAMENRVPLLEVYAAVRNSPLNAFNKDRC